MKVEIKDHTDEAIKAKDLAIERALEIIGGEMVRYATGLSRVDTGLMKNSITYAVDGKPASISTYHAENGEGSGSYGGSAPKEEDGKRSVILGTNVHYAPYNEFGTSKKEAQPFLRPALADHVDKYSKIVQNELKKALG